MAEIKKETPKFTDKELDNMAKATGAEVNKQVKVRIRIPIDPLNKQDLVVPVVINGYVWSIEKGKSIEIPENVAEILTEAGYI